MNTLARPSFPRRVYLKSRYRYWKLYVFPARFVRGDYPKALEHAWFWRGRQLTAWQPWVMA